MFINKAKNGKNNICGEKVALLRKEKKMSQKILAEKLQLFGLNIDKNTIQRIEAGLRFVTDIELIALKSVLDISYEDLLV